MNVPVAGMLLEYGANPHRHDARGRRASTRNPTALEKALEIDDQPLIDLLSVEQR